MMGTMRRNPHCFGTPGHGAKDPNHKHKVKINLENPDPLPDWEPPAEPKPKSYPGRGTRVPTVLRPGTGPYNPNQRRSRRGGRRGLSPMQRRNEQGLRKVKAR